MWKRKFGKLEVMRLVLQDNRKRIIRDQEEIRFSSFSSFHLIGLIARTKSEKQLGKNASDDEDLIIKIDGKSFPKLGSKKALFNSPASFNAQGILSGKIKNPTEATHFHGQGVSQEWFLENIVPNSRFIKQIDDTFFYWSPN